jgi:hypothetical protein
MRRVFLIVLSIPFALTACGGGDDSSDGAYSKRVEGAQTVYELTEPEFSLGVPSSWTAITRDELEETGALDRFAKDNPAVAPVLDGVLQPGSPVKFFALDPSVEHGFATNVNVVVQDVPDDLELSELAESSAAELESLGVVQGVKTTEVSLPAGQAVKITFRLQARYGTASRTVATLQYALLDDGQSYVVTYSTLPELESRYASAFEESARSFRVRD